MTVKLWNMSSEERKCR